MTAKVDPLQSNGPCDNGTKPAKPGACKRAIFRVLAIVLGLALIEGLASLGLYVFDIFTKSEMPLAERQHTQYDAKLGWVNVPGAVVRDMYGPGRDLTINEQGFRSATEYSKAVPPGKTRIICTGDSFALGYGVGDADTFCEQLSQIFQNYEVINMGQGGYGLDQSFLWYERDGNVVDHDLHLVCLGWLQIDRMFYDNFYGYAKPTLKLEGNKIVVHNTPVAKRAYYAPWITQNAELFLSSRLVQFFSRLSGALSSRNKTGPSIAEIFDVSIAALEAMGKADQQRGSRLVVAWLPTREEYAPSQFEGMRVEILGELRNRGLEVIDLVEVLRRQPLPLVNSLFIGPDDVAAKYPRSVGHYNKQGSRFIATELAAELRETLGRDSRPE